MKDANGQTRSRYQVRHVTEYDYGEQVPLSHNVLHLRPRETEQQQCISNAVLVDPMPTTLLSRTDFFGNQADWLSVERTHAKLRIEARCEVEVVHTVDGQSGSRGTNDASWEAVVETLRRDGDPQTTAARQFTFDSPYVPRDKALAAYALPSFGPGVGVLAGSLELTRRIFREFKFDPDATIVGSPVLEVLRTRRGVCQDFAHLMIGCLRSLGLSARYVSGYLVTRPPPGKAKLVGADVSHAWVSVYAPQCLSNNGGSGAESEGWMDFDPTNGIVPEGRHITIGWARDYDDLSPVRGVIVGGATHRLTVSVDVTESAPPGPSQN